MRRIFMLAFLCVALAYTAAVGQEQNYGAIPTAWFKHPAKGAPVSAFNVGCRSVPEVRGRPGIQCLAVVENEGEQGITALGFFWEFLDSENKVLDKAYTAHDFAYPKKPRKLQKRDHFVLKDSVGVPDLSRVSQIHLHIAFVELEDGSVIPEGARDSPLFREVVKSRMEAPAAQ